MRYIPCQSCRYEISVPDDETDRFMICPACYMRQRIPVPEPLSVADLQMPSAAMHETEPGMESDIYDLQTGDTARKVYKETIPIYCKLCHTLMYASAESIGSFLTCPDCGVKTLIAHTQIEGRTVQG